MTNNGRTEYHICGDLTLSGTGSFSPGADTLIVIENGSLNLENNAVASISKTSVVMTGRQQLSKRCQLPERKWQVRQVDLVATARSNQSLARCGVVPGSKIDKQRRQQVGTRRRF